MTSESGQTPETAMLPQAVKDFTALYSGEMMGRHVYHDMMFAKRDAIWQKVASEYPPFTNVFNGFREAFKRVDEIRANYPQVLVRAYNIGFSQIEDLFTQELVRDVYWTRITDERDTDRTIVPEREKTAMAEELGLKDGFNGEDAKSLTLDRIADALLRGQLRFDRLERLNIPGPETQIVPFVEIEGIRTYRDELVDELTEGFDPTSYEGMSMSAYGETFTEMTMSPLVVLGWSLKTYVGVEKEQYGELRNKASGGIHIVGEVGTLPDVRIGVSDGKEIVFPTAELLDNFHVRKRQPSNS